MAAARRKLIAGNWKMNGLRADGLALARELAARARQGALPAELLICPPATLLAAVAEAVGQAPIQLGGQDCHHAASGAFTGDVAPEMLRDAGASYVLVGHSERRTLHGESDETVRGKAAAALRAGLTPVVCIGETLEERDAGQTLDVLARQLAGSVPQDAPAERLVVAYEPVWAIGTGRTPSTGDVAAAHAHIRRSLAGKVARPELVRLLYGGSVKPDNAAELLAVADVDGALVGGASLKAGDFWAILTAVPAGA